MKRNSIPFQRSVEDEIKLSTGIGMNVNERWKEFKEVIFCSARKQIWHEKRERIKKPWITKEMIDKMDERRKWKNKNDDERKRRYRVEQ